MTALTNTMLDAALQYAARDIRVLPLYEIKDGRCACGKCDCKSPGKHPRNHNGVSGATKDKTQIHEWWQKWPGANIGVATGDQFWVLDIDPRHGGNDSLVELIHRHGMLPETFMVDSGSGGRHFYLAMNGVPISCATGILPGIDAKATGGYIVAPPSNHISGNCYVVAPGSAEEFAEAPEWLLEMVKAKPTAAREPFDTARAFSEVPRGKRHDTLVSLAGKYRYGNFPYEIALDGMIKAGRGFNPAVSDKDTTEILDDIYQRYSAGPESAADPSWSVVDDDGTPRGSSEGKPHEQGAGGFVPPSYWHSYDVGKIHEWECEPLQWVVEGILAKGNLCWLAGESQVGKTLFMLFVCLQLLKRGTLFGKFAVNPVNRILYLCLEDPIRRFKDRLLDMMQADIEAGRFVVYVAPGLSIADAIVFQHLEIMIADGGFDLVVIDTWQKGTAGISSFDDEKLSVVIHRLAGLTRKLGTTVIANDHFRKPDQRSKRKELDVSNVKGTQSKIANSDVFLLMDRAARGRLRIKGSSKDSDKPIGFILDISPEGCRHRAKFEYVGEIEDMAVTSRSKGTQTTSKILDFMKLGAWVSCGDLAKRTSFSPSTIRTHLGKLIQAEKVEEQGEKRWKLYRRIGETTDSAIPGDTTKTAESKTSIASNVLPFKEITNVGVAEAALPEPLPTMEVLSTDINRSPIGLAIEKTGDRTRQTATDGDTPKESLQAQISRLLQEAKARMQQGSTGREGKV